MAIVSDANILSSLAAADALDLLPQLFVGDEIFIPQAVEQELQAGLTYGKSHLNRVFQAISLGEIQVLHLTAHERALTTPLPRKLHAGEREGIILCQVRKHLFLSNDKRAIRYCQANGISNVNLEAFLRLLWIRGILSRTEVKGLINTMQAVERLTLKKSQLDNIFAPRRPRRRPRRRKP